MFKVKYLPSLSWFGIDRCNSDIFLDAIASLHFIMSVSHSLTITLSKYNKEDLHNLHGHFKKLLTLLTFRNYKHYLPQLLIGLLTSAAHWPNYLSWSLAYWPQQTNYSTLQFQSHLLIILILFRNWVTIKVSRL